MEIDDSAIYELLYNMELNSKRILGHYGRSYNYYRSPTRYGYDTKLITGRNVEVILTKLLMGGK